MSDHQTPAEHSPAVSGTRWAYETIEVRTGVISGKPSNLDQLNAAGAEGWEAVGTSSSGNNFQVLLKKPY